MGGASHVHNDGLHVDGIVVKDHPCKGLLVGKARIHRRKKGRTAHQLPRKQTLLLVLKGEGLAAAKLCGTISDAGHRHPGALRKTARKERKGKQKGKQQTRDL